MLIRMMSAGPRIGESIIAGSDWNSSTPEYGIVRAQAYEIQDIYYQGVGADATIERVSVDAIDAKIPDGCQGYTQYVKLFSRRYHSDTGPVILRPSEVNLVSVKDEIKDSAWLALPGLFWVWVVYNFYQYGVEHGFVF